MADEAGVSDWSDRRVQDHWFKLRREFESQLRSATADIRSEFDVSVKLASATIVTDGDRLVLRVPVAANWHNDVEQAIAILLITSVHEDDPRISAITHGVADLLERWIHQEVPVGASPEFLYPENEVRWPDLPESQDQTAQTVKQAVAEAGTAS